jgi:hypothetical protein
MISNALVGALLNEVRLRRGLWVVLLVIAAALIAGIVWRPRPLERESLATDKNAEADTRTLRALLQSGADLNKETDVEFYLYFRTRQAAERAAHSVQLQEFSATVSLRADGKKWLCLLKGRMAPTEKAIRLASTRLQGLADSLEGDYDGWEAKVTR